MKRYKILIDCHSFDNEEFQGVTSYIKGLYLELIPLLPDFDFYMVSYSLEKIQPLFSKFPNVIFLQFKSRNPIFRLTYDLPRLILKNKIDWLHVQYKSPLLKFCKEIVTTHDVLFIDYPEFFSLKFRFLNTMFFKLSAKRSDILLTVSDYSKDRISKWFNITLDKIFVIPNGVSNKLIELSQDSAKLIDVKKKYDLDDFILYVSRIEPRKNHEVILKALDTSSLSHINIVFIGTETHKNIKLQNELKISNLKLKQLENIPLTELASFYSASILTIFPSHCEGFGIPPIESLIFKTNCICSNNTAMSDYKNLMIDTFDSKDFMDLRKKILLHINSPFKLKVDEIINNYSWKNNVLNFKEILINKTN